MRETTILLKEVEATLLKAELRIALLNGDLANPLNMDTMNNVLQLQVELESVHQQATKLENCLLKKMIQNLNRIIDQLRKKLEENGIKLDDSAFDHQAEA